MTYYKVISTSVRFMWPFSWGHDESWVRQTSVGRPDALHGEPYYLQMPFLVPPSSVSSSKVSEPGMTSSKDWGKLLRPCCIGGGRSAAILGGVMHTISFLVSPKIQGLRNFFVLFWEVKRDVRFRSLFLEPEMTSPKMAAGSGSPSSLLNRTPTISLFYLCKEFVWGKDLRLMIHVM